MNKYSLTQEQLDRVLKTAQLSILYYCQDKNLDFSAVAYFSVEEQEAAANDILEGYKNDDSDFKKFIESIKA